MQPKLLFGDKDLGRAFQELNETWEVELPIEASLKGFLEGLMAEERAVYLAAGFRERTPKRRDWANGHYVRDLGTEGGLIRALRVPRVRGGGFQSRAFALPAPPGGGGPHASRLLPGRGVHPPGGGVREGVVG